MSDTQFSSGQPVHPNPDRNAVPEGEATQAPSENAASTEAESPQTVEINGREYTEDQIRTFMEGNMRQQDYTRKTQELADMRRQMEQERSEFETKQSELQAQYSETETEEYVDPSDARLRQLNSKLDKLTDAFSRREAKDQETLKRFEAEEALEQSLDHYKDAPFFNRDEMKQWMEIKGLGANQADVAYNSLYGAKVGEQFGHMKAVEHGASTPPVMGAGQSAISPGFTHPSEVPGGQEIDYRNMSWKDITRMAAQDPDIPSAG